MDLDEERYEAAFNQKYAKFQRFMAENRIGLDEVTTMQAHYLVRFFKHAKFTIPDIRRYFEILFETVAVEFPDL